jgi:hypothetical protein
VRGIAAEPGQSLVALLDRDIREAVISANRAEPDLQRNTIKGMGTSFGYAGKQASVFKIQID